MAQRFMGAGEKNRRHPDRYGGRARPGPLHHLRDRRECEAGKRRFFQGASLPPHLPPPGNGTEPLAPPRRMETGRTSSRSQIAGRVLERLFHHYRRFVKEGFSALKETWETYARMKGRAVRVEEGDRTFEGTVNGLNPDGFLLVKTPAGTERVVAGDVFWI